MGEETSWFDLLPGAHGLKIVLQHSLGREWKWLMFQDSAFGIWHVGGALLVPVPFLILGVLVVIVQTLVFCLLSMIYIQGAVAHEAHDEH